MELDFITLRLMFEDGASAVEDWPIMGVGGGSAACLTTLNLVLRATKNMCLHPE